MANPKILRTRVYVDGYIFYQFGRTIRLDKTEHQSRRAGDSSTSNTDPSIFQEAGSQADILVPTTRQFTACV